MMHFMLLFSRQGKLRLQKWFTAYPDKQKKKIVRELVGLILARKPKMCAFLEWKDLKIVYKRYASLYFMAAIENQDNQLLTLEIIHRYVEVLDKYFGSVSFVPYITLIYTPHYNFLELSPTTFSNVLNRSFIRFANSTLYSILRRPTSF